MRFVNGRRKAGIGFTLGMLASSTSAFAQTTIAPLVQGDDPEYEIAPITVGPVLVSPQVLADATYDSNVLASPDGLEISDVEIIVRPELNARVENGSIRFDLATFAEFSRFADFSTENSDIYGASAQFAYSPNAADQLVLDAGYARLKEDRSDPEARDLAGPGPRLLDTTFANAAYRRTGARTLISLTAGYRKIDAVSPLDDERELETFSGSATAGYRVSGPIYATLTGFVTSRNFRLEQTLSSPDRDAKTYGAQVGVSFAESERLRGRARVGLFRFDPSDPLRDARTGLSADVAITYLPTRRFAVLVEAFNGDVATFRGGAQARTDTRVSVTGQVEVRHNLYGRAGLGWVRSKFIGSGVEEDLLRAGIAAEYLVNRRLSLIAEVDAADRSSDLPSEQFAKYRASIGARLRF